MSLVHDIHTWREPLLHPTSETEVGSSQCFLRASGQGALFLSLRREEHLKSQILCKDFKFMTPTSMLVQCQCPISCPADVYNYVCMCISVCLSLVQDSITLESVP